MTSRREGLRQRSTVPAVEEPQPQPTPIMDGELRVSLLHKLRIIPDLQFTIYVHLASSQRNCRNVFFNHYSPEM
jgi:hypothetical protein